MSDEHVYPENSTSTLSHLTTDQLDRETGYRLGLIIGRELQKQGIVSDVELRRFEQLLAHKFSPIWGAFL